MLKTNKFDEKTKLLNEINEKYKNLKEEMNKVTEKYQDEKIKSIGLQKHEMELNEKNEKLENEIAQQELRIAEIQIEKQKNEDLLHEKTTLLRLRDEELGKQSKLQALIHKLSSTTDTE